MDRQTFWSIPNNCKRVTPYLAKLIYFNFHPLEFEGRGTETQLQVGENVQILIFKDTFYSQYQWFDQLAK